MKRRYEIVPRKEPERGVPPSAPSVPHHRAFTVFVLPVDDFYGDRKDIACFDRKEDAEHFVAMRMQREAESFSATTGEQK